VPLAWLLLIWRRLPSPVQQLYLRWRYGHFAIGVAGLIRDERGRILLVHRTYSPAEPWALPGGWLEGRDGVERTLERELAEETGLRVRVGPVLAAERAGFALVLLLRVDLAEGSSLAGFTPSAEVSEVAWVDPAEVGSLSPVNARLLRRALS
jgi:ADP-ribose pyrophosphatase YjhB (NUDIX family)